MSWVANNGTAIQISITGVQGGQVLVDMDSPQSPVQVYADAVQIASYSIQNGILSITAYPQATLTIIFAAPQLNQAALSGIVVSIFVMLLVIVVISVVAGILHKRKK